MDSRLEALESRGTRQAMCIAARSGGRLWGLQSRLSVSFGIGRSVRFGSVGLVGSVAQNVHGHPARMATWRMRAQSTRARSTRAQSPSARLPVRSQSKRKRAERLPAQPSPYRFTHPSLSASRSHCANVNRADCMSDAFAAIVRCTSGNESMVTAQRDGIGMTGRIASAG